MPRIYLAGPEVFLPDADDIGEEKKRLCARYGFAGLFPLDTVIAPAQTPEATGFVISAANEALIASADIVIANLTPFRGPSADVGTVYEIGLARGMGKAIHGYSNEPQPYTQRVFSHCGSGDISDQATGDLRDRDGLKIEEFNLTDNLMIDGGIHASGGHFIVSEQEAPLSCLETLERLLQTLQQAR